MDEKDVLKLMLELLNREDKHHAGCMCSKCCSCTTEPLMEQGIATFAQRANAVTASAMESFQERVNAQNAALIKMQAEITLSNPAS